MGFVNMGENTCNIRNFHGFGNSVIPRYYRG